MKIEKSILNRKRTMSRLMAVQIMYQYHFFDDKKDIEKVKIDVIENYLIDDEDDLKSYKNKIDEDFINDLIFGILKIDSQDEEIAKYFKEGFTLERIDEVVLEIIRFGLFELKFFKDIDFKIIIDEYVDIAACFFDEKKVTFVNAVLDNLAKEVRKNQ